jgi:hypothetical protein
MHLLLVAIDPGTLNHGYCFTDMRFFKAGAINTPSLENASYQDFALFLDGALCDLKNQLQFIAALHPFEQRAFAFVETPGKRSRNRPFPGLLRNAQYWKRWLTVHCPTIDITDLRAGRWQSWVLNQVEAHASLSKSTSEKAVSDYCLRSYKNVCKVPNSSHAQDAMAMIRYGQQVSASDQLVRLINSRPR